MLMPGTPGVRPGAQFGGEPLDPAVVEPHAVDERAGRDDPEEPRSWIAGLRPRRNRADLQEAKAERCEQIDEIGVLVKPGREPDGVRELDSHGGYAGRPPRPPPPGRGRPPARG